MRLPYRGGPRTPAGEITRSLVGKWQSCAEFRRFFTGVNNYRRCEGEISSQGAQHRQDGLASSTSLDTYTSVT